MANKYSTDTIRSISLQKAMYPFQEHKIICCKLFNILNVFQVSDFIAKYNRESNNFPFNNNIIGVIYISF